MPFYESEGGEALDHIYPLFLCESQDPRESVVDEATETATHSARAPEDTLPITF